ncbi:hypothetical protein JTE90_006145 [Oedothorax gibbosus]|uniref:MADF domain-containing protein n=1 Tax=Oedothorax gibbosus TaxID=931172 RepID=A0AAV6TWB9_9ARAC|nr:hypothetical protein JTE90_006145 [Oedothorax gibbosus]
MSSALKQAVIEYVRHDRCIWDKHHPHHKNVRILGKHWRAIAEKLGKKEKDVKMIWKNLRQEFRKQWLKAGQPPPGVSALETALLNGRPEEPAWPFYKQMDFIRDQMVPKDDTPEYQEDNSNVSLLATDDMMHSDEEDFQPSLSPILETSYEDPSPPTPSDASGHSSNNIFPRKTPQMILGEALLSIEEEQQRLRQTDGDRDDNFNFLRSLLPQMRRLDQQKNMLFRVEMQGRLYSLLYGDPQQRQERYTSTDPDEEA